MQLPCVHYRLGVCATLACLLVFESAVADESAGDVLGWMYWTHRDEGIYRAARDGSEVKLLVPQKNVDGLAVDEEAGKLYFTVSNVPDGTDSLESVDIEGSKVTRLAEGLNWTGDLVLDADAGKLYVSSLGDGKIIEIGVDGTQRCDLLTGLTNADEMAIAPERSKLYWASSGGEGIRRANLDGSQTEVVFVAPTTIFGLAIDEPNRQIYWVDSANGAIHRVDFDGKNDTSLVSGLQGADGLALDLDNRKLYWTETGKISQANMDGSGIEALVTGKTAQYASLVIRPPKE
jgi:sugar lactone lactonase YvrE